VVVLIAAAVGAYVLVGMVPVETPDAPWFFFISGAFAICAMILPGISGSFVLLVVGQYRNVLGALQGLQLGLADRRIDWQAALYLSTLAVGCLVGLFAFARLLAWVLKRYRAATLAFLIGLVIGSFYVLWPFKEFESGATVEGRDGEEKAEVRIATLPSMIPRGIEALGVKVFTSLRDALSGADVVMALRIQTERLSGSRIPSGREYSATFGIDRATLQYAKDDAIVMHPGPVNRGVELSHELTDVRPSVILDQVRNGVAIRMAVLYLLAGRRSQPSRGGVA
jgi:hypothetical protein